MATRIPDPTFPEDIERIITETLLTDVRDMCGAIALLSSRFYSWTKPIIFRTIVVRRRNNWIKRISDLLLPNACFVHTLAIDLKGRLSSDELSHVRALLAAADQIKHLAVGWPIWAQLFRECGALQLESLYLIWDKTCQAAAPSLANLQHPAALKDLTVYAPADLQNPTPFRPWGEFYLPDTKRCVNLAYVAYAADRTPIPTVGWLCEDIPHLRVAMFVLVDISEQYAGEEDEDALVREDKELYPNFSTAYLRFSWQILGEWLAKVEGRHSVLEHPPPHAVEAFKFDPDRSFVAET